MSTVEAPARPALHPFILHLIARVRTSRRRRPLAAADVCRRGVRADALVPACLRLGKLNVCWHASHSAARITIRMFPEVKPKGGVRREKRAMRDAKKPRIGIVVDVHLSASGV